jgi:hypothetical protein
MQTTRDPAFGAGPGPTPNEKEAFDMFDHKKAVAVAWLVGSLSMTCVGISQAVAAGPDTHCSYDAQGNQTCVTKSNSSYTSDDGRYHVDQAQDCTTVSRPQAQAPQVSLGQPGTTQVGAVVGCSNNAPAPKGFKAPDTSQ